MSKAIRLVTFPKPKYGEQIVAIKNETGMNIALFDMVEVLADCTIAPGMTVMDTAKLFAERLVAQTNATADLLEALRMVLEVGLADENGADAVQDMIHAAIAKAEGKNVTRPDGEFQIEEKTE